MPNIRKSVLQIVVLHREDDDLSNYTLMDILDECETGDMIRGSVEVIGTSPIITDPDVLREELEAIGNDGTFFDDITESDEELRADCEANGIRIVQSEDEETIGRWDWVTNTEGSDTSFDTERAAMRDALSRLD